MRISACLVIKNEERHLARCLRSIKDLVQEIILVHDGRCTDKSITIAKKYGSKIFTRSFIGEAEYHRPFSYEKAQSEWILQIDADEYLSENSKEKIQNLIKNKNVSAYAFWWPYYDGSKYISSGPYSQTYKPCLFRKHEMYMIGLSHEYPRIFGTVEKVREIQLFHSTDYDKYSESAFNDKWNKWAKIQAKQIFDLKSIPTFNLSDRNKNSVYNYYQFMRRYPIVSGILDSLKYILLVICRGVLWSGRMSRTIASFELRYLWLVRKYILLLNYEKKI